jgi:hypothetical protein
VFDLKTLVRELADVLSAIYEPDGSGFSIEVPLAGDRYQTVSLFLEETTIELLSAVHELDKAAKSTIDKFQKRAKASKVTLEPEPQDGVYRACVRARIDVKHATRAALEPLLVEVASLGDGIERELTGGDVD